MTGLTVWAGVELVSPAVTRAGDWPGWRGPTGCGTTDERGLVLNWDGKSGEGIAWKAPLAGSGHSSPIVWGDRVFITTVVKQTPEQEKNKEIPDHHLACYQVSDGKLLWKCRVAPGPFRAYMGAYAAPTPVTDGEAVFCWFGSAVAAAVDVDGKLLWRRVVTGEFLKKPELLSPVISASMVLYKETVIVLLEQGGGAGILQAWDKRTGEVRWERKRDKDKCTQCNTTPLLIDVQGKPQVVILASQILQSLNPGDGEPLWWCTSARGFASSPLYSSGLVYADLGDDKSALAIDPTGQGDVTDTHVKWEVPAVTGVWSSAVADGEYVYRVDESSDLTCRNLATGKKVCTEALPNVSPQASPIATADGRIYFVSAGKSYVIKAGPKFEVLGGGHVGGWDLGASPAVSGGRIFVRDRESLYCIGRKWGTGRLMRRLIVRLIGNIRRTESGPCLKKTA
jgi:outer membrane protein assembly factor BamB